MLLKSPAQMMKRHHHWLEFVHPEDRERVTAENDWSVATGKPFRCEYRYARGDGSYLWVQDQYAPVRDETGTIVAWQGLFTDISERMRLERELRDALEAAQ